MRTHARSICVGSIAAFVAATAVISLPARSAIVYWDLDGTTAGAGGGATPTGVWDATSTFWNPAADGTGITAAWQSGDTAVFSAGTTATGSYLINIAGTQDIGGLTFKDGIASLSGGTLNLTTASTFSVANSARGNVAATISGNNGLTKTGNGVLRLTVVNRLRTNLAPSQHVQGGIDGGAAEVSPRQRHILDVSTPGQDADEDGLQDVLGVGRIAGDPQGGAEYSFVIALVQVGKPRHRGRRRHQNW